MCSIESRCFGRERGGLHRDGPLEFIAGCPLLLPAYVLNVQSPSGSEEIATQKMLNSRAFISIRNMVGWAPTILWPPYGSWNSISISNYGVGTSNRNS
ncbi:hypothetical protein SUGI_0022170 [Cryptomeria japonica]|nr:hypothetical protein SUGI_0022170 [Cryptomeria japonica]